MNSTYFQGVDQLPSVTLRDLVRWGASAFQEADLVFGHGTDNAFDEALLLVLHGVNLDHDIPENYLDTQVLQQEKLKILSLFEQRIQKRMPAAYLTGEAWFAGLKFKVSQDVLIPRSPIAELILQGFAPWLDRDSVENVLDLCTGSGCIGIASALVFSHAKVLLTDLSDQALKIASENVIAHDLVDRVTVTQSDVFNSISPGRQFDLIVSNPPYVSSDEMATLPAEYLVEPRLGLVAGADGMDVVKRILAEVNHYLKPGGILVVEVGDSMGLLMEKYPEVEFLWPEFESGGHGVFILTKAQVDQYRDLFLTELKT